MDDLRKGILFNEIITKFNDFIYLNFMKVNLSFCIVTFGDDLLTKIFCNEIKESRIKLAPHFYQYFDVGYEFRKFYPQTFHIKTLNEMIGYLKLKEVVSNDLC